MEPPAQLIVVNDLLGRLLSAVIGFAGIVLFILLVVGGFKYITSGGNPDSAAQARRVITFAIIGLVVVASSYLILVVIGQITGADVVNFNIMFPS